MIQEELELLATAILAASDELHDSAAAVVLAAAAAGGSIASKTAREYVVRAAQAHGMALAARLIQQWPLEDKQ